MYSEILLRLQNSAFFKLEMLNKSFSKYLVAAILAGFYVGLAIFFITIIGTFTKPLGNSVYRIFMGISFGAALSIVMAAGSELFTGTNMVMIAGYTSKKYTCQDIFRIWGASYLGNLIGAIFVGVLFFYSGSGSGAVGEFLVPYADAKISLPILTIIFKGILCNILVCLAVLCYYNLKSESAKLIMIFWCLSIFITSGYEHSIANMSLFTAGYLISGGNEITLSGIAHNLLWATFGNIIGGSLLGFAYAYIGSDN